MTASEQLRALRIAESADELADVDTDTLELALRGARDRKYRAEQYGYAGNHAAIVAAAAAIVAIGNELARRQHADDDQRRADEGDEQRDYAEERANAELLRDELKPDDHSAGRNLEALEQEAPHLIAPDVVADLHQHAHELADAAINGAAGGYAETDEESDRRAALRDELETRLYSIARLETIRGELRAERVSYGELAELADLAAYIEPGDVELLEAAGIPEHDDDDATDQ